MLHKLFLLPNWMISYVKITCLCPSLYLEQTLNQLFTCTLLVFMRQNKPFCGEKPADKRIGLCTAPSIYKVMFSGWLCQGISSFNVFSIEIRNSKYLCLENNRTKALMAFYCVKRMMKVSDDWTKTINIPVVYSSPSGQDIR